MTPTTTTTAAAATIASAHNNNQAARSAFVGPNKHQRPTNHHSTSQTHINPATNNYGKQPRPGYNNKAQSFLSRGAQVIVRMRGLPFTCTAKQVVDFFASGPAKCEVFDKEEGVLFVRNQFDKPTGDAFVLFANEELAQRALQKHHQHIGTRYVELFRSTVSEVQQVLSILMEQSSANLQSDGRSNHQRNPAQAVNGFGGQQHQAITVRQHQGRQHNQQASAISAWQRQAASGAGITYAQVATSNYVAPNSAVEVSSEMAKALARNKRPAAEKSSIIQADDEAVNLVSSPETSLPKSGSSASSSGSASDTSAFDNNSLNSSSNSTTGSQASYTKPTGNEESAINDVEGAGGTSNKSSKAPSDQLSSSAQSPVSTLSATSTASSSYKSSHYSGGNQQRSSRRQYQYNGQANNYNPINAAAAAANNPNYYHYHHHFGPNHQGSSHTQASLAYLQHHQFQAAQQGAHYLPTPSPGAHHRHYPPAGPLYMLAPQAYGSYHQQLQAAQQGAHYMPPPAAGSHHHRHYPPAGSALYMLAPPAAYGSFHQPQQQPSNQQQSPSSQQHQQPQQQQHHHHHQLPAHLAYTPYLPFQFYSPPPP